MEKTITITLTLPDNIDLNEVGKTLNEFDLYNESMGIKTEYKTNSEELKGVIPKPKKPNA